MDGSVQELVYVTELIYVLWLYTEPRSWKSNEKTEPVSEPVCRDSSETHHCLLLISLGKTRFKPSTVRDQSWNF